MLRSRLIILDTGDQCPKVLAVLQNTGPYSLRNASDWKALPRPVTNLLSGFLMTPGINAASRDFTVVE